MTLRAVVALGVVMTSLAAADARAEDVESRIGVVPLVGTGAAVVTHSGQLPGFIGLTTLGGEIVGEIPPWGGFLHAEFLSSGQAGRWTALSFAGGASYRFLGAPTRLSLLARGGIAYQRWQGSTGGCDVVLFVPSGCINPSNPPTPNTVTASPSGVSYTGDQLGIVAGVRLELPITPVYIALDASFVPTFDVDASTPTAVLGLKLDLVLGFRDLHHVGETTAPSNGPRVRRGL
jgi:hypothetical protein